MSSLTFNGDTVKTSIPKSLYQAIIRIQAEKDVDFEKACEIAGELVDPRRKDFEKAVKIQVDRRYKSELMTQVNKAKKTISEQKYNEGFIEGYNDRDSELTVPCNVCQKEMILSDNMRESAKEYLISKKWGHAKCHEQTKYH